jgi:prepilin-type N-terminal cleavage/methylation domain-containing protein
MVIKKQNGFTLVELLIVISLIAILSVAVIATINPVEQANKARDAQYQNDAMEYLNALERYKVSAGDYPWISYYYASLGNAWAFGSLSNFFGVCGTESDENLGGVSACPVGGGPGPLITSGELKSSFMEKDMFKKALISFDFDEQMYMYRDSAEDSQVYVCFKPKAKSNQIKSKLSCIVNNYTVEPAINHPTCSAGNLYICVP